MEGRVSKEPAQRVVVRKKQRFFDAKLLYYTALALGVVALIYLYPPGGASQLTMLPAQKGVTSVDVKSPGRKVDWKELGHELATRELWEQALVAYEKYLAKGDNQPTEAGNLCFRMGEICKDRLKEYERAIGYYLQVRYYDPQSPSLKKVGLRVVACLDALGNKRQSQQELDGLTNIDKKGRQKNRLSPVVAQAGSRDFTLLDIDEGIEKLPPQLKPMYEGPQGKLRFLREHLLMPHLLYEAGRRKGLNKDPKIVAKLHDVERNLIASHIIQERVKSVGEPTQEEIELYYKAEQERYRQPSSRTFSAWSTSSAASAFGMSEALKAGRAISAKASTFGPITRNSRSIPGVKDSHQLIAAAFKTELKKTSAPVKAAELYWVIRVDNEIPGRLFALKEIAPQVKNDLMNFRRQQEVQKLLDEQIKVQQVKMDRMSLSAPVQVGGGQ